MCRPEWYSFILLFNLTVFIRLNVVAFIKFFVIRVRRLFEGGVHTGVAFIQNSIYFLRYGS